MSGKSVVRRALIFAAAQVFALLLVSAAQPALARDWRPSSEAKALDYSQIVDSKGKDVVIVWWFAAPAFNQPTLDPILKKYFILGIVHAHMDEMIDVKFLETETPTVKDTNGNPLKLIPEQDQPPGVIGILAGFKSVFVKMIGPMGQGMKLYVYEAGSVDACKTGKVTVPSGGEVYTYDTPIPGCPAP